MTPNEQRIRSALSPTRGDSAHDRTSRIASAEVYQKAAEWFVVPEGKDPREYWQGHRAIGKWFEVVGESSRVLDLGCGVGWPTLALAPFVREIVGVDASPEMIEIGDRLRQNLDRKGNASLRVCDASNMPFEDAWFDAVISDNLIDIVDNQRAVLKEVLRVLKPGGRFALDFESFKAALGDKDVEEGLAYENYDGVPKLIYTVRTAKPSYLEREYVLYLDPESQLGSEVRESSDEDLKRIPHDFDKAIGMTQGCRYWESVHHDNATMSALLSETGFADMVTPRHEGYVICRRPAL